MHILMTGGTGLVGRQVGIALTRLGHNITALTRKGDAGDLPFPARCVAWDHKTPLPADKINPDGTHVDAVIHLAGEPVAQRWTTAAKKRIYESRITSTKSLIQSIRQLKLQPATWLNASAIGIYGDAGQHKLTETSPAASGFLSDVCRDWESALDELDPAVRRACLRFGIILSSEGGALQTMLTPFRYGFGGSIGHGSQQMSWIHIDDAVEAVIHTLNTPGISGPINIVAPESTSNREFTQAIASTLKSRLFLPVPEFGLKFALGEMSEIVTASTAVRPEKLLSTGFVYKFSQIGEALADLLKGQSAHGVRQYVARQWLPGSPAERFPFFSAAENLERITPPWLHFKITKKSSDTMANGVLIDYKLRIKGLPVRWRTRITNWNPPVQFADEQLRGPYEIWHHTHSFEPLAGGTLMTDRVLYKIKFWPFGDVTLPMVKNDISVIFAYRKKFIAQMNAEIPKPN